MNTIDTRRRRLRLLALGCAVLMLATIGLSAFMRLSQAGLGCTDWPACYGQSMRDARPTGPGVTAARLAHRVVALFALISAFTMVLLSTARPVLVRERRLSVVLVLLALALSLLGIATPGARVPAVAIGNLLGGFAMLALCWRLAAVPGARARGGIDGPPPGLGAWGVVGLVLVAGQVALGAQVSASFSALACADLADCSRLALQGPWDWQALNPWREPVFNALVPSHPVEALTQWLHRVGATVVVAVVVLLSTLAWRRGRRHEAAALLLLTLVQAALGPLLLAAGLPMALVLTHNLVAALLLALLARLA